MACFFRTSGRKNIHLREFSATLLSFFYIFLSLPHQGGVVAVVHDELAEGEHVAELGAHRVLQKQTLNQK